MNERSELCDEKRGEVRVLSHDGHRGGRDGAGLRVGLPPELRDRLELRVELNALFAVEVRVAHEGGARAGEGEHRQRHGDRHLHAICDNMRCCSTVRRAARSV